MAGVSSRERQSTRTALAGRARGWAAEFERPKVGGELSGVEARQARPRGVPARRLRPSPEHPAQSLTRGETVRGFS
jgi:hypothetical protein